MWCISLNLPGPFTLIYDILQFIIYGFTNENCWAQLHTETQHNFSMPDWNIERRPLNTWHPRSTLLYLMYLCVLNGTLSNSDYSTECLDVTVICFLRYCPGESEENYEKPSSGGSVSWPRFKLHTYQIQVKCQFAQSKLLCFYFKHVIFSPTLAWWPSKCWPKLEKATKGLIQINQPDSSLFSKFVPFPQKV